MSLIIQFIYTELYYSVFTSRYIKQIFDAFLFNITNYLPELNNVQRQEAELNIILPRVSNFGLNKKVTEYLFYYMPPTPNKTWEDKD